AIRHVDMGRLLPDGDWRIAGTLRSALSRRSANAGHGCEERRCSWRGLTRPVNKKLLIPLVVFVGLVGFLMVGLFRDPREIPSPLIDKPAPQFTLAQLHEPDKTL